MGQRLLCRVRQHLCALPLESVVETLRPLPTEPLAGAPPFVLGVALIRGRPLPVVDLGRLVGGQEAHPQRFVTIRTGDTGERQVALAVDGVVGVTAIDPRRFQQLPPLLREAGGDVIEAIGCLDSELLLVLRSARILPEELFRAVAAAGSPA